MMRHLLLFSCWVMSNSLWPLDCSPAGSSVHGILQARTLEWVTTFSSRGSSPPRDQAHLSCLQLGSFPLAPSGKPMSNLRTCIIWLKLSQHDPSLMDSLWPWASCKDLVWGWETINCFSSWIFSFSSRLMNVFIHWAWCLNVSRTQLSGFSSHLAEWLQEGVMEARREKTDV